MGLTIFDMGIPSYKYLNWQNKRLYGMVLFEDIPQIIIQIIYINVTQDDLGIITSSVRLYIYVYIMLVSFIGIYIYLVVSIAWTCLSIFSSIFSFITNKSISDNNEFVIISMDITNDNDINYTLARAKFTHIKRKIGIVLRISSESIAVLKPLVIADGVCIKFIVNTKTYKEIDNANIRKNDLSEINHEISKFKDSINDSKNMERLIKEFNQSWNLDASTKINNIDIKYMESIKRKENTVQIELENYNMNNDIQKEGNDINSEMMNVIDNPNIEGTNETGYMNQSDSDKDINHHNNL